jgi:hypothetical protein
LRLRFRLGWQSLWSGSHGKSRLGMRLRLVADPSGLASIGSFTLCVKHLSEDEHRWVAQVYTVKLRQQKISLIQY